MVTGRSLRRQWRGGGREAPLWPAIGGGGAGRGPLWPADSLVRSPGSGVPRGRARNGGESGRRGGGPGRGAGGGGGGGQRQRFGQLGWRRGEPRRLHPRRAVGGGGLRRCDAGRRRRPRERRGPHRGGSGGGGGRAPHALCLLGPHGQRRLGQRAAQPGLSPADQTVREPPRARCGLGNPRRPAPASARGGRGPGPEARDAAETFGSSPVPSRRYRSPGPCHPLTRGSGDLGSGLGTGPGPPPRCSGALQGTDPGRHHAPGLSFPGCLGEDGVSHLARPGAVHPHTAIRGLLLRLPLRLAAELLGSWLRSCPWHRWLLLRDAVRWGGEQASQSPSSIQLRCLS